MAVSAVKVVLYRHGETEHNKLGVISGGSSNPSLTPAGEVQAEKVGELLRSNFPEMDGHYCSDLQRAERTARLALGESETIVALPAFREIDHGGVDGILPAKERNEIWKVFVEKAVVEWKEAHPGEEIDPFFKWKITPFSAEKAETLMQLWDRVSKQIFELVERHKETGEEKTITIGCHNAVIQVLVMMSEIARGNLEKDSNGLYPMFFERNLLPNGAVAVFEVGEIPDSQEPIKFREFVTAQQALKV
ncbi:MAG: histidine phosphatase family protein [Verrucomicrobia bacterium]|nr:histidine phosphatase family protein [Verrucomicrobiota bacterium]